MPANTQIAATLIDHAVDISRYTKQMQADIVAILQGVEADVVARLEKEGNAPTIARTRLMQLRNDIRRTLAQGYLDMAKAYTAAVTGLAKVEASTVPNMLNKALNANIFSITMTGPELEQLAVHGKIVDGIANDFWKKQETRTQRDFENRLGMGIVQGETNEQLITRTFGTLTGGTADAIRGGKVVQVPERTGGVFQASKADARALVRTGAQQVSNQVLFKTYEGNRDVLRGVMWLATLDNRTTPICRSLDHCSWDFNGAPLKDSRAAVQYPGPPPIHFNCRSVLVPLTKSWADLAKEAALKDGRAVNQEHLKKLEGNFTPSSRASMSGSAPSEKMDYESWLKAQSVQKQKDILGARYKLWSEGKATFQDMVQAGKPITLRELEARSLAALPVNIPNTAITPAMAARMEVAKAEETLATAQSSLFAPLSPPADAFIPPEAVRAQESVYNYKQSTSKQAAQGVLDEMLGATGASIPQVLAVLNPIDALPKTALADYDFTIQAGHIQDRDRLSIDATTSGGGQARRSLYRDSDGALVLKNEYLRLPAAATGPDKAGAQYIEKQFERASQLGVERITTYAAGDAATAQVAKITKGQQGFAGYSVWPKFGYNAPMTPTLRKDLIAYAAAHMKAVDMPQFRKFVKQVEAASDIRELATSEKSTALWAKFGSGVDLTFDSRPGSADMKFMKKYASGAQ